MTPQERLAQETAAYQTNLANYNAEKNSLRANINTAQDALNQAFANKADGKLLTQLADNLMKAKKAFDESQQKWGPAYTGLRKSLSGQFGISTPTGVTFTTAQKQAQNPLYNPLYDPGSDEYQAKLASLNPAPPIKNPLAQKAPQITKPSVETSSLTQAVKSQNQSVTPNITLPSIFQQNQNVAPSVYPPATQGIKMPTLSRSTSGSNWSDLLSVAHNRYTR